MERLDSGVRQEEDDLLQKQLKSREQTLKELRTKEHVLQKALADALEKNRILLDRAKAKLAQEEQLKDEKSLKAMLQLIIEATNDDSPTNDEGGQKNLEKSED